MLSSNDYRYENVRSRIAFLLRFGAWSAFVAVGAATFFYIPWKNNFEPYVLATGISLMLLSASLIVTPLARFSNCLNNYAPRPRWIYLIIGFGVILRIAWVISVEPKQTSDMVSYMQAAQRIVDSGDYLYQLADGHIFYAWRAVGYPAVLALFITLLGSNEWVPFVVNLLSYIGCSLVIYKLAKLTTESHRSGLLAALMFAVWPAHIMMSGLALGEGFSLFLFTFVVYALILTFERESARWAILTGLVSGVAVLTRPSLLVIPVLWFLFWLMQTRRSWYRLALVAVATITMAATVAPWSYRNFEKLGAVIPVSTNGGDNFYRANNPLADGTFKSAGERDLSAYAHDEVLWNETGYEWGKQWIAENPGQFILLAIRKQGILLGDETFAAAWSLDRAFDPPHGFYRGAANLSTLWWTLIWILTVAGVWKQRRFLISSPQAGFVLWMSLLFVVIHSVYESQDRYHLPMIGILCVLATLWFDDEIDPDKSGS